MSHTNIYQIVKSVLVHLSAPQKTSSAHTRKTWIAERILVACSADTYALIDDFEWYITVLVDISACKGVYAGLSISKQLIDIMLRVPEVREFTTRKLVLDVIRRNNSVHFLQSKQILTTTKTRCFIASFGYVESMQST
jgi:hypothetical protein